MSAQTLALIPARGGSKSIPRKNIRLLGKHPLIAYSISAALAAQRVERVIVSTDDPEIAEIAREYGAEVPFLRPPGIAEDDTPDFPVFIHALTWLAENEDYYPDFLVQLRPTSPIRWPGMVDEAVAALQGEPRADSLRGVIPAGQNPYKMWRKDGPFMRQLMDFRCPEPFNLPRQALPESYWQTGHIDVIRRQTIVYKHSLSGEKVLPLHIDARYGIDIDTEVHWAFAEWLIENNQLEVVLPVARAVAADL
ncbi:MAG TPA: acylneuraminate cytidylyltransferase family protein [Calditrichia bacterium]|nr:acylneuraminate cytidylyltransferase family protein [Calditrichia bacterium]